jgi:hypothetical protein
MEEDQNAYNLGTAREKVFVATQYCAEDQTDKQGFLLAGQFDFRKAGPT